MRKASSGCGLKTLLNEGVPMTHPLVMKKEVLFYEIDILIRGFLLQLKRDWQSEFYAN